MKALLIGALLGSVFSVPAFAALKNGENAPDFKARASLAPKEFQFSLADALKKGPVVVYFDPAASTRGCNLEAHAFAESKGKFDAAGATIIGVSQDNIQRLPGGTKESKGREIANQNLTERTTFVITPDKKVLATLSSADDGISPTDHVDKSLAIVAALKK